MSVPVCGYCGLELLSGEIALGFCNLDHKKKAEELAEKRRKEEEKKKEEKKND